MPLQRADQLEPADYLGILNFQIGIANILAWLLEFSPNVRLNAHPVVNITSFAGPILLLGHGSFKTSFINAKTFISRIFLGQFNWEAIGIIQLKGRLAIDLIAAICLGFSITSFNRLKPPFNVVLKRSSSDLITEAM